MLRSMEGHLAYLSVYIDVLMDCHNAHVVGQCCLMVKALIDKVR